MKYFALLLITTVFYSSCKKDVEIKKEVVQSYPSVISVGTNSATTITDINPDTLIHSYQVQDDFLVDINSDGINDFNLFVYNSYGCVSAMQFLNIKIETLNGDSYISSDSLYPKIAYNSPTTVTSQTIVNAWAPKVLSANDSITISDKWKQGLYPISYVVASSCPPNGNYTEEGYWVRTSNKYIAVRYQNRLGWIKIDVINRNSLKIYEYAISN